MSEPYYTGPEGVVLWDRDRDELLYEQTEFRVLTNEGERVMRLRVARGVIADVKSAVREEAAGV